MSKKLSGSEFRKRRADATEKAKSEDKKLPKITDFLKPPAVQPDDHPGGMKITYKF